MSPRWFGPGAALLSVALAAAPALACERHQEHVKTIAPEVAATAPLPVTDPSPTTSTLVITPAAAVEASQSLPVKAYRSDCLMRRTTQALTQ